MNAGATPTSGPHERPQSVAGDRRESCVVCGAESLQEWHPAQIDDPTQVSFSYTFSPEHTRTFRVVRCRACSHAFCSPVPANIADHYLDVRDDEYLKHEPSRRLSARALLEAIGRHQPGGRLLDVGCATGDFLAEARERGYQAEGLELSEWSSQLAGQRGIPVHRKYLAELAREQAGSFDVISLWGVIEHFARPREEMGHISRLLKPGGVLALWTGDVDSITSRLLGRRWWYWQGQHIQYFTHRSLIELTQQSGLQHVRTQLYPFAASFETISNSLRRYKLRPLMVPVAKALFAVRPIWYLRLPGEMFFLARRPGSAS
jgi:2-polyprenyl-3-methyl-5-hydroxy-6-metoxy-1,4-benzoquinol methylase